MAIQYVTFGTDPTVFQQDSKTGELLKAYGTWDQLLKDNPSGAISAGKPVPSSQWYTDGKGAYGFKLKSGENKIIGDEQSYFQATGKSDWGTINEIMTPKKTTTTTAKPAAKPAAKPVKIADVKEKTVVKFADNPTTFEVQNGTILGEVKATPSQEVTVVERPPADSLYKSGTDPTVYGLYEGLAIPFGSEEEFVNNEGADAWGEIETKTDSEILEETVIQSVALAMKEDAVANQMPEVLDMPFDQWLNNRLTVKDSKGKTLKGQEALQYMVAEDWAGYRKDKVDYLKNTYNLTQKEAEIEYNNNKQTYEAGMNNTLQDLGIEKTQLQEDLNTRLTALGLQREYSEEDLAAKREELGADYNKQLEDYTKSGERTQEDIANKRSDLLRDYTADIEQYTTSGTRIQEDVATKKTQLEQDLATQLEQYQTTGQRTAEDIAKKKLELEQDLNTRLQDYAISTSRIQSDVAKKKVELQQDLEKQLDDYTTAEARTREDIEKKRTELQQDLATSLESYSKERTRLQADVITKKNQLQQDLATQLDQYSTEADRTAEDIAKKKTELQEDLQIQLADYATQTDRTTQAEQTVLGRYDIQSGRLSEDLTTNLNDLETSRASFMDRTLFEAGQSKEALREDFAGRGLFRGSERVKQEGVLDTRVGMNISDYLAAYNKTKEGLQTNTARGQQDITGAKTDVTTSANQTREDILKAQQQAQLQAGRGQSTLDTAIQRAQEDRTKKDALAQQLYGRNVEQLTTTELRNLEDIQKQEQLVQQEADRQQQTLSTQLGRSAEDAAKARQLALTLYGRDISTLTENEARQLEDIMRSTQQTQTEAQRQQSSLDTTGQRSQEDIAKASALAQQLYGRDISTLTIDEQRKLDDILKAQQQTTGAYQANTRDINLYGDRTAQDTASNISYLGGQYGRELTAAEQAAQRTGTAIGQAEQAAQTGYNRDVATADLDINRIGQEYNQLYGTNGSATALYKNQQAQDKLEYSNAQNELDQSLQVQQAQQQGLEQDQYAREYDWLREPYTSGA